MNRIPNVRDERQLNRLYQQYCQTYTTLTSDSAVKANSDTQKALQEMNPCKIADINEKKIQVELSALCGKRARKQKKAIQQELVGATFNEDSGKITLDSGNNLQIFDETFEFSGLSGKAVTLIDTDGSGLTSREAVYYDPSDALFDQNSKLDKLYRQILREKTPALRKSCKKFRAN
ncbi:hypothetical protein [Legionella israelensis]|uniref:Uncharacterized protein n=1 Tax=Legionella israelensis TaxID=454 RepID=A0A0W0W6B3_9GAMM|nr:hypothetical protein [Legionella israelensis]KTD27925.1 hypothetical protein Lisr_0956 [Legionella israelensis]QBS09455.1 hypothetical protein E4T55_06040 [Legionella israelensis]SCX95722.1 hypothetical protein SAMN02746069_00783 [Legionella israelensis DSM 19235]STX60361.1 Uncharacterised protein [Legionella israelensis]